MTKITKRVELGYGLERPASGLTLRQLIADYLGKLTLGQQEQQEIEGNVNLLSPNVNNRTVSEVFFLGTVGIFEGDPYIETLIWNRGIWVRDRIYLWPNELDKLVPTNAAVALLVEKSHTWL